MRHRGLRKTRSEHARGPAAGVTLEVVAQPAVETEGGLTHTVHIGNITLQVLADTKDREWYQQRKTFEEQASPLYELIKREGFESFVDVGANVGLISILARRAAPDIRLVAIEADPRLVPLIRDNLAANGAEGATVIHALLGEIDSGSGCFSLNPSSTLDNRVDIQQWQQIEVSNRSMDSLLVECEVSGRTFFKIDTQGYEQRVLLGMANFLAKSPDWMLKMEFAPHWLASQGTDPGVLLNYLIERYEVAEYAERIQYGTDSLEALFAFPLAGAATSDFIGYVRSLNRDGLGWVDLVVRPRVPSLGPTFG